MFYRNLIVLLVFVIFFVTLLFNGVKSNHLARSRSTLRSRQWHLQRQRLSDTIFQNSVLYESILLELLRRRLGVKGQNAGVTVPRTVSLPPSFITTPKQTIIPTTVTPSSLQGVPKRLTQTRMSQRRSQLVGTPLELMAPNLRRTPSPSRQNQRNPKQINSRQTKNQPSRTFDGTISLNRHGGFEFQTSNGVRVKLPRSKSGKLVIKSVTNGVEVNYVTPRPRREEEMEFEL